MTARHGLVHTTTKRNTRRRLLRGTSSVATAASPPPRSAAPSGVSRAQPGAGPRGKCFVHRRKRGVFGVIGVVVRTIIRLTRNTIVIVANVDRSVVIDGLQTVLGLPISCKGPEESRIFVHERHEWLR